MIPFSESDARRREARQILQKMLGMIDRSFLHEIQQHGLEEMVRLTDSGLGFFATIGADPGTIRLRNRAVAGKAPLTLFQGEREKIGRDGYWSTCLASLEPVIRNRPVDVAPRGLVDLDPITRDLTLPILDGANVVAAVGVANRAVDYSPDDAELLWEMAAGFWRVLVRKRLHDRMSDDLK